MKDIRDIFERITERYQIPVRIGSRCEATTYYRVDSLSQADLEICASYIADRIAKVCHPHHPELLVQLPGSYTGLVEILSIELAAPGEKLEVLPYEKILPGNGVTKKIKNTPVVLVNDVITTARSCVEAHTKITMMGASILCWAALIDRTFGPGPVPVITAFTGDPVTLLEGKLG